MPDLEGRVATQFVIGSEGKVVSAVPSSSTIQDPGVATCITQATRRWSFPRPKEGVVLVTYPFIFENR